MRRATWRPSWASVIGGGLIVLLLALAIGPPFFLRMREHWRQDLCKNRLGKLAKAVQRYHHERHELPPLATADGGWSWYYHILPHVEGASADGLPPPSKPPQSPSSVEWIVKRGFSPDVMCPSRRTKAERTSGPFIGGQPTDFAAVSTSDWDLRWTSDSDGVIVYRKFPPTASSPAVSGVTWDDVVDGLSSTALLGERHMRQEWLGGHLDEPALVAFRGPHCERLAGVRAQNRGLAAALDDADPWKFGAWHPAVVQFAMCDGSVRPLAIKTDLQVLSLLTSRKNQEKDGRTGTEN